ncbi:DUF1064 domain-containing protein [Helcococcus sueciensis]|uniref:DUF1064 domain-containing protein n=1 Tax=Helcococcus sueciensis TaxID=241555 RepID=UPI0004288355|nr:DUF1064 domain-containing protein [Helcococcus sueciensis]
MRYNKYKNKKSTYDGITFDSKKEMNRYRELKLLEKGKAIKNLELQPEFLLIPTLRYENQKTDRKTIYKADFKYENKKGQIIVEDVKGFKTDVYQIKRKLLIHNMRSGLYGYEFEFKEV